MKSPIATAFVASVALLGLFSSVSAQVVSSTPAAAVTFGANQNAPAATQAAASSTVTAASVSNTAAAASSSVSNINNSNSTFVSASTVVSANVTVSAMPTPGTSTAVAWVTPAPVYPQPISQAPSGPSRPAGPPSYAPLAPSSDNAAARPEVAYGAVAGIVLAAAGTLLASF
ncbi:hypothetical protein HDU87_007258 [Geranomyces variabilis]|uniref:Uncharacterized protein n=1 Tax=Geranomyces variabilis TaxID=109894 RepID=A0AAD5TEW2_9FUNG|nr:hypothetical protein HDU87_007258 [Geranomyces variabilis]